MRAALAEATLARLGADPGFARDFSVDLRMTGRPKDHRLLQAALRLLEDDPDLWRLAAARIEGEAAMRAHVARDRPAITPYGPDSRERLYDLLARRLGAGPIDYLEFGVWQGASLRWWLAANAHPASRFFAFDSFEGLPDHWLPGFPAGHFDTGGRPPALEDARLRFVKGWFNETVPPFARGFVPAARLVVNVDCDLYGSTLCVLTALHPHLAPGTLVIFDELALPARDELAAFLDYRRAYGGDWRLVATWANFGRAAFERV
jgi:hypothetical protein